MHLCGRHARNYITRQHAYKTYLHSLLWDGQVHKQKLQKTSSPTGDIKMILVLLIVLLMKGTRIVIPQSLQENGLCQLHISHMRIENT